METDMDQSLDMRMTYKNIINIYIFCQNNIFGQRDQEHDYSNYLG